MAGNLWVSLAVGLMLVFRTNESYARFVRAHDAWNSVLARATEAHFIVLGRGLHSFVSQLNLSDVYGIVVRVGSCSPC